MCEQLTIKADSVKNVRYFLFAGNARSLKERIYLMLQFSKAVLTIIFLGRFAIERPRWWNDWRND